MTEEEMMKAHLEYARAMGFRNWPGLPGDESFNVDIRGTVTYCRFTDSISIDYHDLFAYWAPNRKVSYCEGDADVLRRHLEMNGNNSAIAEWAKKGLLSWA